MSLSTSGLGYEQKCSPCGSITNCNVNIYGKCHTPLGPSFQAMQRPGGITLFSTFSPAVKTSLAMMKAQQPKSNLYNNKSTLPIAKGEQIGVL